MSKTKIIAMYLPQYHRIPENDEFWGEGFTDWVTVRNAKPLFKNHEQPKVPLNENYYDLSEEDNIIWQSELASQYGIDGFGVYHYWFNNEKNLLTKPAEIIRDSKKVNISYFLAWDNANWVRSWSNVSGNVWTPLVDSKLVKDSTPQILIPYIIGDKSDWKNHYENLRSHFLNERYIKINNKPVFVVLNYSNTIGMMCDFWNELAINDGFNGMHFIMKIKEGIDIPNCYHRFKYEPVYSGWTKIGYCERISDKVRKLFHRSSRVKISNYDIIWETILENAQKDDNKMIYHGAFVAYDDTPRRGNRGRAVIGNNAEKFYNYLKQLEEISLSQKKDFILLTAWNEWGEGAYLEPDTKEFFNYLESIHKLKI